MTDTTAPPLAAGSASLATLPILQAIDVNSALTTVGIVIALIAAVAAAYYTVKAKNAEVWRETAEGHKAAHEVLSAKNEQLLSLIHEKDIQIAKLDARPNLDGLATAITTGFATQSDEHHRILNVLETIASTLGGRRGTDAS